MSTRQRLEVARSKHHVLADMPRGQLLALRSKYGTVHSGCHATNHNYQQGGVLSVLFHSDSADAWTGCWECRAWCVPFYEVVPKSSIRLGSEITPWCAADWIEHVCRDSGGCQAGLLTLPVVLQCTLAALGREHPGV
jgi:hypothetical protein